MYYINAPNMAAFAKDTHKIFFSCETLISGYLDLSG